MSYLREPLQARQHGAQSVGEVKRKSLERRVAMLVEDYNKVNEQIERTSSALELNRLERQAEQLFDEMTRLEAELAELERPLNANRAYLSWDQHLPKLDFVGPTRTFDALLQRFQHQGAALLLLPNSQTYCGDLLLQRIKARLKDQSADFKLVEVGFQYHELLDAHGLLHKLGPWVDIQELPDNLLIGTKLVIDRIYDSLQPASILLIEISIVTDLNDYEPFLRWLVEDFWRRLIKRLHSAQDHYPLVKLFGAIVVNAVPISDGIVSAFCCTEDDFQTDRILRLSLSNWNEDDILGWLLSYSGLSTRLQIDELRAVARGIAQGTGGQPLLVRHQLQQFMEHHTHLLMQH